MSDCIEWQVEHVVQHVRKPLRRLEPLKNHKHRKPDRVGKLHLGFGVSSTLIRERLQVLGVEWLLSAQLARAQRV